MKNIRGRAPKSLTYTILLCGAVLLLIAGFRTPRSHESETSHVASDTLDSVPVDSARLLYEAMGLESWVSEEIFRRGYEGYCRITDRKRDILTLVDFTKPSSSERLLVLDMAAHKLLYHSLVAHGRNSGDLYATRFSNRPESHQSSLGFYLTEGTYNGSNGYSLRLNGLEKGINDNALARAIVIHGAAYADPSVCRGGRRLGRSWGCPALPPALNRPIIDTIKDGTVLYIHAEDPTYLASSQICPAHCPDLGA